MASGQPQVIGNYLLCLNQWDYKSRVSESVLLTSDNESFFHYSLSNCFPHSMNVSRAAMHWFPIAAVRNNHKRSDTWEKPTCPTSNNGLRT